MPFVHTIDLEYLGCKGSIAAYLVIGPLGPVLVETGPASTSDALTRGLAAHGFTPDDVHDALVTHIHLDHAGAAGWLAARGARIHVHEFGARHLIDPSKLISSATRIYGAEMDRLWGEILPVPEAQVMPVRHGDEIHAGGMRFRTIETPGHARHHHAFALEEANDLRVAFTGDAAACFIPEAPTFISLPTPPPEFDPEAWRATLAWLHRERFDALYPTHFGKVDAPEAHLSRVDEALSRHIEFVASMPREQLDRDEMVRRYRAWMIENARKAGVPEAKMTFYVKAALAEMNLTGILRYFDRAESADRPAGSGTHPRTRP